LGAPINALPDPEVSATFGQLPQDVEGPTMEEVFVPICKDLSVEVIIFRGSNRNKRAEFTTWESTSPHCNSREHGWGMKTLTYSAIQASQSPKHTVLTFAAKASDVLKFAAIDRIGRNAKGDLSGFQRPQNASHICEIRITWSMTTPCCPIRFVIAFTSGVSVKSLGNA